MIFLQKTPTMFARSCKLTELTVTGYMLTPFTSQYTSKTFRSKFRKTSESLVPKDIGIPSTEIVHYILLVFHCTNENDDHDDDEDNADHDAENRHPPGPLGVAPRLVHSTVVSGGGRRH